MDLNLCDALVLYLQDIEDIRTIQSNTPSKNIFFVVSKLDCNEEADTSESSYDDEEDDDDDDREERVKQQENKIMQMVGIVVVKG